jgi:hypothetical protein
MKTDIGRGLNLEAVIGSGFTRESIIYYCTAPEAAFGFGLHAQHATKKGRSTLCSKTYN